MKKYIEILILIFSTITIVGILILIISIILKNRKEISILKSYSNDLLLIQTRSYIEEKKKINEELLTYYDELYNENILTPKNKLKKRIETLSSLKKEVDRLHEKSILILKSADSNGLLSNILVLSIIQNNLKNFKEMSNVITNLIKLESENDI